MMCCSGHVCGFIIRLWDARGQRVWEAQPSNENVTQRECSESAFNCERERAAAPSAGTQSGGLLIRPSERAALSTVCPSGIAHFSAATLVVCVKRPRDPFFHTFNVSLQLIRANQMPRRRRATKKNHDVPLRAAGKADFYMYLFSFSARGSIGAAAAAALVTKYGWSSRRSEWEVVRSRGKADLLSRYFTTVAQTTRLLGSYAFWHLKLWLKWKWMRPINPPLQPFTDHGQAHEVK